MQHAQEQQLVTHTHTSSVQSLVRSNCLILSAIHGPREREVAERLSTPPSAAQFLNIARIDLLEVQQLPSAGSSRFRIKFSHSAAQQHAYGAARSSGAVFVEGRCAQPSNRPKQRRWRS